VLCSGSQGIGLQTTIYLAQLGASVYVCTLDNPQNQDGILAAKDELRLCQDTTGTIEFHELDLATVSTSRRSAETLKSKIHKENSGRLDIIVANAGTAFQTKDILSVDGVERTFAVNCLGHFVFITTLLGK
jgi:NAD(P)-dependent dehydrogenase (short-subunit alcohol dehydrogenase family)